MARCYGEAHSYLLTTTCTTNNKGATLEPEATRTDAQMDIATLRSMIRATDRRVLSLALEALVNYYGETPKALLAFEHVDHGARKYIKALVLAA